MEKILKITFDFGASLDREMTEVALITLRREAPEKELNIMKERRYYWEDGKEKSAFFM